MLSFSFLTFLNVLTAFRMPVKWEVVITHEYFKSIMFLPCSHGFVSAILCQEVVGKSEQGQKEPLLIFGRYWLILLLGVEHRMFPALGNWYNITQWTGLIRERSGTKKQVLVCWHLSLLVWYGTGEKFLNLLYHLKQNRRERSGLC